MSKKVAISGAKETREELGPVKPISVTREGPEVGPVADRSKKYHFKEGRMFTHPPQKLIDGNVEYCCTLFGSVVVKESSGTHTIKDAVDRLRAQKKAKDGEAAQNQMVELSISIRGIIITDARTKVKLHLHPVHYISFCAEDKRTTPYVIAYIARSTTSEREHTCYVFHASTAKETEDITATIGEAFELAYQRYQENKSARKDFAELKASLQTPSEKEEFTLQLQKLQKEVQHMELESKIHPKPPLERFPKTVAKWDSITSTLEPFAVEPSMDPSTMYLVPRPETKELDAAIAFVEQQLKELDEGFAQMVTVKRLTKAKPDISEKVMSEVEGQVKDIQAQNESLEEPALPSNYQMEEYSRAKSEAAMPKSGTVKEAATQWPPS